MKVIKHRIYLKDNELKRAVDTEIEDECQISSLSKLKRRPL